MDKKGLEMPAAQLIGILILILLFLVLLGLFTIWRQQGIGLIDYLFGIFGR